MQSTVLSEACYMCDWNSCDLNICKSLFIIMERGKKPVVLTAGKLFSLTLNTLMTVFFHICSEWDFFLLCCVVDNEVVVFVFCCSSEDLWQE